MAGTYVFLLLREHEIYLLNVYKPVLYAVFGIWKRWEWSGLESKQIGGVLRVILKTTNKWIVKKSTTGTNWTRNCGVPLGISDNKGKSNSNIVFGCLINSNCIWSRLLQLVLPPWKHLQEKQALRFHNLSFPRFFPSFWSAITAVCNSVSFFWQLSSTKLDWRFEYINQLPNLIIWVDPNWY